MYNIYIYMKCCSCDCEIIINPENYERNLGIEKDNKYYCIPCHEALLFLCDINENKVNKKEQTVIKKNKINSSHICCYKCNKPYENNKCNDCNIINPLSIRPSKKKKKKKKK